MFTKAGSGRDAFTFSLHGMTTIASFTVAPATAQDRIDKARGERLAGVSAQGVSKIRRIENFLGRYFATGCCQPI
jgi:hypothetical protein